MPLRRYAAVALMMISADALAQMSKSIGGSSDYWYRGISLSSGLPVVQATLNHDFRDGWYAGASGSGARNSNEASVGQLVLFGGNAMRLDATTSLDFGAHMTRLLDAPSLVFTELYAGIVKERYSLRLYYSPRYLGEKKQTTYLDFNMAHPLSSSVYLSLHLGWLESMAVESKRFSNRFDTRLGIGTYIGFWNCQVTYNMVRASEPLTVNAANRVILNLSYSF
ncbi:TorF family putative porin [Herbaspirillum huttiense]|jgi:uncharacterized protein (TIGR02001 family)|uniref:TorF family putative porin n=1 Tax=Herbaspirillum huttiense TaxID=863372 RepID=UPI001AC28A89|nr:TorF family putative porin [Herbaspirillum huttiense]MBN9359518.1 hypothetical protein [Herbaspirillum huttiense]